MVIDQVLGMVLLGHGSSREPFRGTSKRGFGPLPAYEFLTAGALLLRNPGPMETIGHQSSRSALISSLRIIVLALMDGFVLSPNVRSPSFPMVRGCLSVWTLLKGGRALRREESLPHLRKMSTLEPTRSRSTPMILRVVNSNFGIIGEMRGVIRDTDIFPMKCWRRRGGKVGGTFPVGS